MSDTIPENKQLTNNELHQPIPRNFKKSKVYSTHRDNICSSDLEDLQLTSKQNKRVRFLPCVVNVNSK